ncbi:hypothetical protein [Ruminococcus flavefaciens]|uniref:Uncharacterized protein n=1 Tax=Ruminococcus flavefaciens TaxID=1265 RepID=A0A1M7GB31_RUMFL|nr:hypothetical protein [Ruminococcus flavefaciens]SHM13500.1 hypothetical protein SAMN04487860_101186 [Ruminococcus flavefaciens]
MIDQIKNKSKIPFDNYDRKYEAKNIIDNMIDEKHFADTLTLKEKNEYLKCFYKKLSYSVKANLRREYYDRIISGFDADEKLSTEQMQDINNRQKYSFIEKEAINESKRILHEFNLLFNKGSSVTDYENALFDLAFIIEKRNQHIDKFKKIVQEYKSISIEKYKSGLTILKKLNEEYNVKIKEAINNVYFK